jgi:hypothetical protein
MSKLNKTLLFLNVVIIIGLIATFVARAWTNPTSNPPSGGGALYYYNGNVGIGTTAPGAKLDVRGSQIIGGGYLQFTDSAGSIYTDNWIGMANNVEGTKKWLHIGGITDAGGDNLRRVGLWGDKIYMSGNVGIGTTGPDSKLHVAGGNWNGITLTGGGNQIGTLKYDPTGIYVTGKRFLILSDETTNADGTNAGIMFRINNGPTGAYTTPAMVIRESGNVGIGTTGPQASQNARNLNLDVLDNIIADDIYLRDPRGGNPRWASDARGFGGIFHIDTCNNCYPNPFTGSCSCPDGFFISTVWDNATEWDCSPRRIGRIYQCWR